MYRFAKNCLIVTFLAASLSTMDAVQGAGWGTLKGKFVFKGDAQPVELNITKDVEFCSKHDLVDESVVVGDNGTLSNVFVFLYTKRGAKVDVHPDYEEADLKPAVLDNQGCQFEPRAMTVWTKQSLEIRNSDDGIGHNTNATLRKNPKFNETITNDKPITKQFDKSEPGPAPFACNVHPWMSALVLIRDNPYMAVSNAKGEFEIKNLPAGEHEFVFFHETPGYMKNLPVGKEKADRKGRVEIEIADGKTVDLGEIVVSEKILGR